MSSIQKYTAMQKYTIHMHDKQGPVVQSWISVNPNLVPRAMPVRGLALALAVGKRNEIRNFIGCREINNLGAA